MRPAARLLGGALGLVFALGAGAVRAEPVYSFAPAAARGGFEASFERVFAAATPPAIIPDAALLVMPDASASPTAKSPKYLAIGGLSVLAIGGSYYNARSDGPQYPWHTTREGWFGRHTYSGGGDKASHFVSYYIVAKLMSGVNMELGMPQDSAALLGTGVSLLAGLATEIGDGTNKYGFSWEDITTDAFGAAASLAIFHYGLDDLIGFRAGRLKAEPAPCCPYGGTGKDYTEEIYTGDLKFAGLAERMRFDAGLLRYFMFSVSYSAKGYPYANPDYRERQVGFEVGINFLEVFHKLGIPPDKWWSKILYFAFDVLRFPYTQIGMYYDMNNGHWYGPGIGNQWHGYGPPPAALRGR